MFWTWIPLDFPPFSSSSSSSTSHNRKSQTRRRWPDRSSPPSSMETKMVVQCLICKDESHVDDECPLPNSPCNFRGCNGTRKVRISTRPHSLNRRFLRCNAISCKSFVWIDEETQGQKTLITSNREACYCCGDKLHFVRDCPVKNGASVECKSANCAGKLKIFTSKKPHSYGKKFFACNRPGCGYFQWLEVCTPVKSNVDVGSENCSIVEVGSGSSATVEVGSGSSGLGSSSSKGSIDLKIHVEGTSSVEVKLYIGDVMKEMERVNL